MVERICPECKRSDMRRSSRHGLFESFLFPLFGRFPWRCRKCGTRVMLRDRGNARHTHRAVPANGRA